MKRFILILFVLILSQNQSKATHLLGGEITWECISGGTNAGKMIFTLKLYRACYQGAASLGSSATINNPLYSTYGGPASITVSRIAQRDLSPECYNPSNQLSCGISPSAGGDNAMEENVYVSGALQINGTPATTGSAFWTSTCCRPGSTLMRNINGSGYWLRAIMYPYTDPATNTVLSMGSTTAGATCYDSSPYFAERPATIICTGYEFTYNHNAVDSELDSLSYSWTNPMVSATNGVTWKTGYSVVSQLPGTFHNSSNVPAQINALTGEIKFTTISYNPPGGYHSTAVKVTSYKCRQRVAEIFRDIPVILVVCPPTPTIPPLANTPPNVDFKWAANAPTTIPLPAGDTVWAGDSVNFYITSTDIQFLPGFTGQTNYLLPSGSQFGTDFADSTAGCEYPPCAILDTTVTFWNDSAKWWAGTFGVATRFSWKTACNHLAQVNACFTKSNTYNFVFKVLDDWCPAPGMNFQTFAVTVLAPPAIEPPKLTCAQTFGNGNVLLKWTQPVTDSEDTLNSFRKYMIHRSDSGINGPYDTLHIVKNIDSLVYLDASANAHLSAKYYFIRGLSSCNDQGDSILSDTISSMRLTAQVINSGNGVALNWNDFNPGNRWGNKTMGEYYVWQILNGDTTLIDTTIESWDTLSINLCYPSQVDYMITVVDTTATWGCISNSTSSGGTVGDNLAPDVVLLDSVSYDQNNVIQLGWTATAPDVGTYYIYKLGSPTPFDSIPGSLTTYTYNRIPSDPWQMDFAISARDTCDNANSVGTYQEAMKAKILDVVPCDTNKKAVISWNKYYPNWNSPGYTQVWRSTNNGPYVLMDSVISADTIYEDTSIAENTFYKYRVRSSENGGSRSVWSAWDSVTVKTFIKGTVIPAPDLRCVSWENDSTIRLWWVKPNNIDNNFNRYIIHHSNLPGPGAPAIDSVNSSQTGNNTAYDTIGYTYENADPNQEHFFFVTSSSGCDGLQRPASPSATLRALNPVVTSISDSVNQLDWDPVVSPQMAATYVVERNSAVLGGNPSYGTETKQDMWIVCNEQVEYQVKYYDGGVWQNQSGTPVGCHSTSRLLDGEFVDDTPPAKQFLDSVSMKQDTTFTGLVGWSPNPSSDVEKYYVLQCLPGSYDMLDTVDASMPLVFEDLANAPRESVTQYSVTAIDSCGNNNLPSLDFNCHTTMNLKAVMDFCDQSIRLSWNEYSDFSSGINVVYVIYVEVNGGGFTEAGRTTDAKFKYQELVNGNNYCFYVQAWENGGVGPFSSSTAVRCLDAEFINKPAYAYTRFATVSDTNTVRIAMKIDLESDIGEYWIKRSTNRETGYKIIGTIPVPDPPTSADSNFYFEDNQVYADRFSYFYKIDVVDPCGTVGITSNIGRTIVLTVEPDNERNKNILKWNQYEEWAGGVNEYEVYRGVDLRSMELIRSLPLSQFDDLDDVKQKGDEITFTDDVSAQATTGNGQFCYMIVAKEGSGTFQGVTPEVSKSNIVCTVQKPMFYVPTAFTPNGDGLNDKFLPRGAFHEIKEYKLEVYNRWGERIYETEDYVDGGWDGTINGKEVPTGAYVYIVNYTSADGEKFEQQGTISLTR